MIMKYNLTEDDYLKFNLFHIKNSKTHNRTINTQRFVTPIFLIIFAFLFSLIPGTYFQVLFIITVVICIMWLIFYPKYYYYLVIRNAKKMIREGKNDGILGEHILNLNEAGLIDTTLNGETKVNWTGIKVFKEDDDNFYLYNSSVSSYVIPKQELTNVEEIRNYIISHIKT